MGLFESIQDRHAQIVNRHPVGGEQLTGFVGPYGHDQSEYSPAEYGNYLVSSSTVFSAASLRARLMSKLPIRLYKGRGPEKEESTGGQAVQLLRHVNPFWTWQRLQRMDELSMCLWGETFWAHEPPNRQSPHGEIWWLKPSKMQPVPDTTGYLKGFWYVPDLGSTSEPIFFQRDEIIWFRYPNPLDEFSPLSPLAAARLAADTQSAMMKSNRNLFSQGMQIGGFVRPANDKVTFSPEQATQLEQLIDQRFRGTSKAHKWAVLRFEAQFEKMNLSPKDAEFIQGLKLTLADVANAYGVPVPLLNDLSGATLANVKEYERILWANALMPDAELRAGDIEEQLLTRFRGGADHAAFDFDAIPALQESASESWARERQAIEVGAMTINEWRRRHGMRDVPWGDVWYAPVNKMPVDELDDHEPDDEQRAQAMMQAMLADSLSEFERQLATFSNGHGQP